MKNLGKELKINLAELRPILVFIFLICELCLWKPKKYERSV